MTTELHRALFPRARLDETHLPRCEPEQHLVAHPDLKARIQLEMDREPNEEIHDVEREERMTCLFAVCRDHAIIAAEVACRDAIHLELELIVKMMSECCATNADPLITITHFIYDGRPTACLESRSMPTVPTEEFIRSEPV
jgi:hypothetical protein